MGIRTQDLTDEMKRRLGLLAPEPKTQGATKGPYRSQLEADYAAELAQGQAAGVIAYWRYEPFRWKLAPGVTYCPDFMVVLPSGVTCIYEVKGYWRDDARVKSRWFAQAIPAAWQFIIVTREDGQWCYHPVETGKEQVDGQSATSTVRGRGVEPLRGERARNVPDPARGGRPARRRTPRRKGARSGHPAPGASPGDVP